MNALVIDHGARLFAKAGETVTCENGHPICDAAHDLVYGELQDPPNDWTNWRQPEPPIGTLPAEALCVVCGAQWFGAVGRVAQFHFEDGWRS